MTSRLQIRGLGKSFPGIRALNDVSIDIADGEIHALVGENGAGKSTLIKIITGVFAPDEGEMLLAGVSAAFRSPREAIDGGIGAVHQERNLVPRFTVAENICLDRLPVRHGLIDRAAIRADATRWLDVLGVNIPPGQRVRELSVAQMQLVEIAKALSLRSKVLLLDEPTASITPHEADLLFGVLRELQQQGVAMLFVSHRLEEVLALCDRITVLRDGRNACVSQPLAGMTRGDIVKLMIGRDELTSAHRAPADRAGPVALSLAGVATAAGHSGVDLSLRKGEILGLYGLVGAGRSELAKAVIGTIPITGGEVRINGQPARIGSVAQAVSRYRIGYVSEDRKGEGVVLEHTVASNIAVTIWLRLSRGPLRFLAERVVKRAVVPFTERLDIRIQALAEPVAKLSGGNQQKVSVAKWLAAGVEILILDEPTVGIDVRTKAALHTLIRDLADRGAAILVISSDMPEVVALADRIEVMKDNAIIARLENTHDYPSMSAGIMAAIHQSDEAPTVH